MASDRTERRVSCAAALVLPILEIGTVGYVTWVTIVRVAVDYLLRPPSDYRILGVSPRKGAAIAVMTQYFLFLFLIALSYSRFVKEVGWNPGLIPLGRGAHSTPTSSEKRMSNSCWKRGRREAKASRGQSFDEDAILNGTKVPPPGLRYFYRKEVFICGESGLPLYCHYCRNWKPDRAHHCSAIGRCVRRMDHFCPWVGGIVSETTMKFFIQFVTYGVFYCVFILVLMAVLIAERRAKIGTLDINWVVVLGLAGLFGLFSFGMCGRMIHLALKNSTTVEEEWRFARTYHLAVHIDLHSDQPPRSLKLIRYPSNPKPGQDTRTFAVIQIEQEDNIWDLGPLENLKSVMGNRVLEWFLPITRSPYTRRNSDAEFPLGPDGQRLVAQARGFVRREFPRDLADERQER